jgi:hypothetical protein
VCRFAIMADVVPTLNPHAFPNLDVGCNGKCGEAEPYKVEVCWFVILVKCLVFQACDGWH